MTATNTNSTITLDQVLSYQHSGAVRRYIKEQNATAEEAAAVFQEMLKFLYLSYRAAIAGPEPFGCVVSSEIAKIDEMWHTFLLFTVDYADFCESHFGAFLHHVPNEAEEEATVDEATLCVSLTRQFELVYDVLGEETLRDWYDHCLFAMSA